MRYSQLINESFRDAKNKFIEQSDNKSEVNEYLETFKLLSRKSIIKGQDKDIGKWIKAGWREFKAFIDDMKDQTSLRQQKHEIKKDVIKIVDNDAMMVVIPLTDKASCYYGRQTQWCTAATESENAFYTYFLNNRTLFYVLIGDRKLAASVDMNNLHINYYDASDNAMRQKDFESITGINEKQLYSWTNQHKEFLNKFRENSIDDVIERISKVSLDDIVLSKKGFEFHGYIQRFTIPKIESLLLPLDDYFNNNPIGYKKYKDKIYNSLEQVMRVLREFTDDTNELYVPIMEHGLGDYLSSIYPPFNDYMKQLIGRHYEYLNTTKVIEINKIRDDKEKDEAMYKYKKGIEDLLKSLSRLKK